MELTTDIEIESSAERVWAILADLPAYPTWNPFVRSIDGELREGAQLTVRLGASGTRARQFRPRLKTVEPDREIRWLGRLVFPGLFDGEHMFRIEPIGSNRVRFVHSETFGGLLVPLLRRMLERDTKRGFVEMNEALKAKAESTA